MKKSVFIRMAGWVGAFLWLIGWGDCLWGGFSIRHYTPLSAESAALLILFGFPFIILWFAGSTAFHLRKNRLEMLKAVAEHHAKVSAEMGSGPGAPHIPMPGQVVPKRG